MNDDTPLTQRHCVPCEGGTPPMDPETAREMMAQVPGWELGDNKLTRRFKFRDFAEAMAFVNRVADLSEAEGHHPDIHISWNRVRLDFTTHAIKGLSDNDFIMAARTNEIVG
ncbi:MAG TPA: 4a-hydroxytetrahydrobiopterin dehydratase [Chloroflexia bacterium]|nr:4a-hydroxytetrahydrobiopterin dehydratase [Chloroflexia bacterium]